MEETGRHSAPNAHAAGAIALVLTFFCTDGFRQRPVLGSKIIALPQIFGNGLLAVRNREANALPSGEIIVEENVTVPHTKMAIASVEKNEFWGMEERGIAPTVPYSYVSSHP